LPPIRESIRGPRLALFIDTVVKNGALSNPLRTLTAPTTPATDDAASALHAVPRPDGPARAPRKGPALGEILVESKTLTEEQLREAMTRQQRSKKRLGEILMELGFASPDEVLDGLSTQLGVPPTRVNSYTVTPEALAYLSEKIARKYTAMPLIKVGSTLMVATANPRDLQALDDLRFAAGCEVQTMIALESEIQHALATFYGNQFDNNTDDERASVVVDVPAVQGALATRVGYVGVMGSRKTHEKRMQRLAEVGVDQPEQIDRLMSPIGLDIGARTPEETAISICAEIIAHRTGRETPSLRRATGPIHG